MLEAARLEVKVLVELCLMGYCADSEMRLRILRSDEQRPLVIEWR
jgi:hypothetical protein